MMMMSMVSVMVMVVSAVMMSVHVYQSFVCIFNIIRDFGLKVNRRVVYMKEKSIVLDTWEVQAVLEGKKTRLSQVIKPQPDICIYSECKSSNFIYDCMANNLYCGTCGKPQSYEKSTKKYSVEREYTAMYQPGDILWVREKFFGTFGSIDNQDLCYATHCPCGLSDEEHANVKSYRPSIHMPRAAARIFLRVTDVRAERVQDITPKDLKIEGIIASGICGELFDFIKLWNSRNAKRGYGWDVNPWVFVYELERVNESEVDQNGD